MKIMLIGNTSWSMYNFRKELISELISNGNEVFVIAPYDDYSKKLISIKAKYLCVDINGSKKEIWSELKTIISIYDLVKAIKPNLVINYTIKPLIYGGIASFLNKTSYISVVTGVGGVFLKEKFITEIIKPIYKFIVRRNKYLIFLNKEDKERYEFERLIKKNSKYVQIFPGEGVDENFFSKNVIKVNKKINEKFIIFYAGRLLFQKGLSDLVAAVHKLQNDGADIIIHVAGITDDFDDRYISSKVITEWSEKGLIKFFGYIEDVRGLILQSDCVALPSTYGEGLPKILLEAASLEVPIIASDIVGCREIVINGINGYLHKPRDKDSIAIKIEKIINDGESKRKKMGAEGRKLIEQKFSSRIIIEKYKKLIN